MRHGAALLLLAALATPAHAQGTPQHGAFVSMLGVDTMGVETWTRTATTLTGDRVTRTPRVSLLHYEVTLGADGRATRFEVSSRPGNRLDLPPLQSALITFQGDSAHVTVRQGDSTRTYAMRIHPGAVPMMNNTYALYGLATREFVAAHTDSLSVDQVFPGVVTAQPTFLKRVSRDTVSIDYFGNPIHARVDSAGRFLGMQGLLTTVKVVVTAEPEADVAAIAQGFAAAEAAQGPMGRMSHRDTARADIDSTSLYVDYSRPRARGRKIMGGVVPFGEVWRTGADAATQFSTDHDLQFGEVRVPKGLYTLWTLPSADGAQLIINRQTGQWGTEYDPTRDLARIPMQQMPTAAPVEMFTINIRPRGDGGVLIFEWGATRWEAPFTLAH